jgi:hypothetical protein
MELWYILAGLFVLSQVVFTIGHLVQNRYKSEVDLSAKKAWDLQTAARIRDNEIIQTTSLEDAKTIYSQKTLLEKYRAEVELENYRKRGTE